MSKIKLVDLVQYTRRTAKRYQHGEYGILPVTVLFGSANGGGADTIYLPLEPRTCRCRQLTEDLRSNDRRCRHCRPLGQNQHAV
jgi:hypothetical protein